MKVDEVNDEKNIAIATTILSMLFRENDRGESDRLPLVREEIVTRFI